MFSFDKLYSGKNTKYTFEVWAKCGETHSSKLLSVCAVLNSSPFPLSFLSCLVFGFAFLFAPISPLLFSPADWRKGKGERGGTKKETGEEDEEEKTGMSSVGGEKWRGREGFAKFLF